MTEQQEPGWKRNGRNGPFDWWLACKDHGYAYARGCLSCELAEQHNIEFQAKLDEAPAATPAAPVAKIEAEDATRLASELEALRQAHWTHWTAAENHTTAVAVRHLRLLADHNAAHGTALPKEG